MNENRGEALNDSQRSHYSKLRKNAAGVIDPAAIDLTEANALLQGIQEILVQVVRQKRQMLGKDLAELVKAGQMLARDIAFTGSLDNLEPKIYTNGDSAPKAMQHPHLQPRSVPSMPE